MERFKKIFAAGVIFVTVLSMSVVVAPSAGATASAGDLIKMSGLSSVYYLAADGKRYVFPNESTYFSWYSDFSSVVTIPQSELESYPLGKNVTVRPGTKLVKITTNPKVYAVTANGTLVGIPDEATALALFGANWNKRIIDVSDAFFTNYTTSSATVSATAYPQGSLVKFGTSADVYLINADGTASKISTEAAFVANRFKWADVITATIAMPTAGAAISGAVATLTDTSSGAGGVIGAGTGLTVALASDTPASATVVVDGTTLDAQANVPFVKVNFTASADGDVVVKNLKFKRAGISSDTDLDGLFLYDGATRLTDGSSISSNYTTFNNASGLFTVTKGTTKSITLKGDMYYDAGSGKTIGFNLVAATDVTTNGAAVSGSFPVAGNLMSTAAVIDLGKLVFSVYDQPSSNNLALSPALEQEIWKFTMTGTNQALSVEKLKLTAVGSVQLGDMTNFKLIVAGVQVGPTVAAMASGNVVEFDMSAAPLAITKGGTKSVSVRADVVNGSTRTFYMSFQNQNDIIVKDTGYNVYIEPYLSGTFAVLKNTDGDVWLIDSGALSVSKATESPIADVALDATGQTLVIYNFSATGEDIKVQNLNASTTISSTNSGLQNCQILVDGIQVGTTKNLTANSAAVNFTFGSTFIVKAGTTAKVKVICDIKKAAGTSYAGAETVIVALATGSSNAQRQTSLGTFNVPASTTNSNTLTITSGAVSVSKYSGYANQTLVAGTNDAKLGSFVVSAGAAEGVTVSSITVALDTVEYSSSTLTRMYLKDHATGALLGSEKTSLSSSNNYSVSFTLGASANKVIDLYGDIKSGANAGPWIANIDADGNGVTTGLAVSASAQNIQTITLGSGSLTTANGSMPDAAIVLAGAAGNYMAQYTFSAANEGFTIDKLRLKVANNFATSTAGVYVKYKNKAGTVVTSPTQVFTSNDAQTNSTSTFTSLTFYVPADDDAQLDVYVDMVDLASSGVSGATGAIILEYNEGFNATGDAGTSQTNIGSTGSADLTGNSFYNRKSKPTFAKLDAGSDPVNGALYKFSVIADSRGNIEIKQLSFTVATTACTVTSLYLYDTSASLALTDVTRPITAIEGAAVAVIVGDIDNDVLTISSTAKTYELRGAVTGYSVAGDQITVGFKQDVAAVANDTAYTIGADGVDAGAASKYNVWSDRSSAAHTTATSDWTNGYLIKDMTVAQSFSK